MAQRKDARKIDPTKFLHLPQSQILEIGEGGCLDRAENILILEILEPVKRIWLLHFAREWCLRGRQVLFTTASALVQDLLAAKRDLRLNVLLKRLDKFDAIVIDDISYIPQNRDETDVLFVLLSERYETRSLVITSNLPFSQWDTVFKDAMTTMAAIDRLVHHSIVLELNGESYRAESAKKRNKGEQQTGQK
ncbi:MAG: ATP-binding protein [Candidatus Obscuribacter sp.]|nr:ATP-binding protein [Candidatus Obscuribacter sp.]